ncbi:tyrosine-type recombinase/integrase [Erythrobacter aureus]|uniref:tyrosine-type recombinase/integrase n=1 Tax=Erythrobacter aureus TaxID=2182384 RepID=UPI003A9067FB
MSRKFPPTLFTEAFIASLNCTDAPFEVRDAALSGFIVKVNKRSKVYKIQRDLWVGKRGAKRLVRTVRRTLGTTDELTLRTARQQAMLLIEDIKSGIDINAEFSDQSPAAWTVADMYNEYVADMRMRDCADVTIEGVIGRRDRLMSKWLKMPLKDIKRSMCRTRHQEITTGHGKYVANQVFREFRAAYNIALRVMDEVDDLPDNPVKAVTFNKERSSGRLIMPEDLPHWWERVDGLLNPLRKAMHELGIFSGLRPGTLASLEIEWVKMNEQAILIPRMKAGRPFALPLSAHMMEIVWRAIGIGQTLYPGTKWIFPSRSSKTGEVIACQVWKEKSLPSETGHILRHTYRTVAQRVDVDPINRRLLLDHKVPGIDGVYVHEQALFDKLLESQELVTAELLRLMGRTDREPSRRQMRRIQPRAQTRPPRRMLPAPRY